MTFGESKQAKSVFLCLAICGIAMIVFSQSFVVWLSGIVLLVIAVLCLFFHIALAILDVLIQIATVTIEKLFRRK
jgi:hypothetical protein